MGKSISLMARFTNVLSPASYLSRVLKSDFSIYFKPKSGRAGRKGNQSKFGFDDGIMPSVPFPGEDIVGPGVTSLRGYPDVTQNILEFLEKFPEGPRFGANFVGDVALEYFDDAGPKKGMIFRHSYSGSNLVIFSVSVWTFRNSVSVLMNTDPWFFTRKWRPEEARAEMAEYNWASMVTAMEIVISAVDNNHLLVESNLNIEGLHDDEPWLTGVAQRLPKLTVSLE